jgi:hypothetical protein
VKEKERKIHRGKERRRKKDTQREGGRKIHREKEKER